VVPVGHPAAAIEPKLAEFIAQQKVFFVATAPSEGGHVNLSPKGLDSLRVLDETTVVYADLVGSGAETIAHLRDNGRITLMFCAFEGPPKIVRIYGRGEAVEPGDASFDALRAQFPELPGLRAFIRIAVERVADSCGYAVPLYAFQGERDQLHKWVDRKGPDGLVRYQRKNNLVSIDGLPALRAEALPEVDESP
jgi:hypothetical protein